jgi:hypothetical protein
MNVLEKTDALRNKFFAGVITPLKALRYHHEPGNEAQSFY